MRIVKNELNTQQWNILNYLKQNAVGERNLIGGKALATIFNMSETTLRKHLAIIRKKQSIVIGANMNGYYIPLEEEREKALRYAENKNISELETRIKQNPSYAFRALSSLWKAYKEAEKEIEGQTTMQFNGWEKDFHRFGNKYLKENKK